MKRKKLLNNEHSWINNAINLNWDSNRSDEYNKNHRKIKRVRFNIPISKQSDIIKPIPVRACTCIYHNINRFQLQNSLIIEEYNYNDEKNSKDSFNWNELDKIIEDNFESLSDSEKTNEIEDDFKRLLADTDSLHHPAANEMVKLNENELIERQLISHNLNCSPETCKLLNYK